ncbi:MAG TPA: hypothetical protein VEF34_15690 [Syntrophobacteraceae bacterium]|nr:hypothetical protein [Syntrophobacteraceae bacterium]
MVDELSHGGPQIEIAPQPCPFDDFSSWLHETVSLLKPDIVVAIARGAVRLLQLHGLTHTISSVPIISNNSLSFIPQSYMESKRALIFDDSLIFGSTMSSTVDYLHEKGAVPLCAAYVVDRRNFFGEGKDQNDLKHPSVFVNLPVHYRHKLWPSDIRIHHDVLVRCLLNTPSHYNIDFPTTDIQIPPFARDYVPFIMHLISSRLGVGDLFDVTSPDSAMNNIYRFSVLLPTLSSTFFRQREISSRPFSKVRFTLAPDLGLISITPMVQLVMGHSFTATEYIFSHAEFQDLWDTLGKPLSNDRYVKQSTFRLLTYFITTLLSAEIVRRTVSTLREHFNSPKWSFLTNDIEINVGKQNALKLHAIFHDAILQETNHFLDSQASDCNNLSDTEPIQHEIIAKIADALQNNPHFAPDPSESVYEILGKIFIVLRKITDSSTIREKTPNAERLNVGLSFGSVMQLLKKHFGITLSLTEISVGIDVCVDNGLAVPKILSDNSQWCRLFYSGERTESVDPLQLKSYFFAAYSEFMKQKKSKPLTPYDIHKLSCGMKEIFRWLPFSTQFSIYGRIALAGPEDNLISWLSSGPNPVLSISRSPEGKKVAFISDSFRPISHTAWSRDRVINFLDGFQYMAFAFNELGADHKLVLSTCMTHRHTYNSVAHEAHCWSHKSHYNFSTLVSATGIDNDEQYADRRYIAPSIYWCVRYIHEATVKYNVFHRKWNHILKRIDTAFKHQGFPAKRFWEMRVAPLLNQDIDPEIECRFEYLMQIINQIKLLTSYFISILLASRVVTMNDVNTKFIEEGVTLFSDDFEWSVKGDISYIRHEYNRSITQGRIPGTSIVKTLLPGFEVAADKNTIIASFMDVRDIVFNCYNEIRRVLQVFCPEYKGVEGDFPYAPFTNIRVRPDGAVEQVLHNAYILTMDIIKSTNSPQTNEMKSTIIGILSHFDNIHHEVTGNDEYIVCSNEPAILIDIADAIRLEGERLKKEGLPFGGTRKALGFGTVKKIEDINGNCMIMDECLPNIIPAACSVRDAIDMLKNVNKNSLIAVARLDAHQFKKALAAFEKSEKRVKISSKHFVGSCSVYDLSRRRDSKAFSGPSK